MESFLCQALGLFGAFLYLLSYFIIQVRPDFVKDVAYSLMNLVAAASVVIPLLIE